MIEVGQADHKYIIRTSDRLSFKRCRRAWNWSSMMRENLVPVRGAKPLEFGTSWHHAMALYYDPLTWHLVKHPKTRPGVLASIKGSFVAHNKATRDQYVDESGNLDLETEEDFEERKVLGVMMLDHYFEWAIDEDRGLTPVYVEVDFEVPILQPDGKPLFYPAPGGPWDHPYSSPISDMREAMGMEREMWPVFYQGRLDGIVTDQFGFYWILEHKTAAQMADTGHLVLDEQTGSYAWALQHQLGIRVSGIIYNEALKDFPEPPQQLVAPRLGRNFSVNKNARTTYELAYKTLVNAGENLELYEDYLGFLKLEGNKFCRRTPVRRNANELKDMGERIYWEALDMLNWNLPLYPNPSRFACMQCAFRSPCIAKNEGSDYQFILDEGFRHRTDVEVNARRARA